HGAHGPFAELSQDAIAAGEHAAYQVARSRGVGLRAVGQRRRQLGALRAGLFVMGGHSECFDAYSGRLSMRAAPAQPAARSLRSVNRTGPSKRATCTSASGYASLLKPPQPRTVRTMTCITRSRSPVAVTSSWMPTLSTRTTSSGFMRPAA